METDSILTIVFSCNINRVRNIPDDNNSHYKQDSSTSSLLHTFLDICFHPDLLQDLYKSSAFCQKVLGICGRRFVGHARAQRHQAFPASSWTSHGRLLLRHFLFLRRVGRAKHPTEVAFLVSFEASS